MVIFDAAYDTAKVYTGNLAAWVESGKDNPHDPQWSLSGNSTRLGANLSGPANGELRVTGKFEADFSGGGAENQPNPRLRHAYVNALWVDSDTALLAGQTWDLVGSLIPPILNAGIFNCAGNIGYRHPQLRVTKGFKLAEQERLELAAALSRSIGETDAFDPPNYQDTGRDARFPTLQYRAAYSRPLWVEKAPATVALSGHYGQEEWDTNAAGNHVTLHSYSTVLELDLPLTAAWSLAGEAFTGQNLDDFWGGIKQGVNGAGTANPAGIKAYGGWCALKYKLNPRTTCAFGAAQDNPRDSDLGTATQKTRNSVGFANVIYKPVPPLQLGLELSQWETDYLGQASGHATRVQTSVIYSF